MSQEQLDIEIDKRMADETWAARMSAQVLARDDLDAPGDPEAPEQTPHKQGGRGRLWMLAAAAALVLAVGIPALLDVDSGEQGNQPGQAAGDARDIPRSVYGTAVTHGRDDAEVDDLLRYASFSSQE